jgi:hypothetical protein
MQVGDALDPDAAQLYRLEGDQHTLSLPAPMGNPALLSLGDGEPRIALSGGAGRTPAAGMAVLGVSDEPPRLSAGRSDRLVTAPVLPAWLGGEQTLIARVGSPLVRSGEQLILAAGGGQISKLSTGRDKPSETGENILTQVERDRVSGLVVGAGVATPTDTKSAQLLLVRPRQPMLGLHVGTHAHRESEHTILARGDEWLRPSLVAG